MEPTVKIALRAARKAGDIIVRATERMDLVKVHEKEKNDFVTSVDSASEDEIREQLQRAFPEHNILGEEGGMVLGRGGESDTTWYIDPLDGTTNFMRGIPHFAISIACVRNNRVEHAVVFDPIRQEEFVASRGRGASLNGRRIRVSNQTEFNGALIGTGVPYRESQRPHVDGYMQCLQHIATQGSGVRRAGAAALDLAYVAAGRLDAFWEYGLKPWDVAAGMLLIQEAGGLIADFDGGDTCLEKGNVVCGPTRLFKELLKVVHANLPGA